MAKRLYLDTETMDIVFMRDEDGPHFNIVQQIKHHSPTGMEWGYGGSGPADFALNILQLFLPGKEVKCWKGRCSQEAWQLHQDFKWAFTAGTAPREGGTISCETIRNWIELQQSWNRMRESVARTRIEAEGLR